MTDDVLKRIGEKLRSDRPRLSSWMTRNHDGFAAALKESVTDWELLAEEFTRIGFTARGGKPLTAKTVERTWYRVRHDVAATRRTQLALPKPAAVSASPVQREPDRLKPKLDIRPARPIDPLLPTPTPVPKSVRTDDRPTPEEVQEQNRKMDEQLKSRSGKMPDPIY